MVPPQHNTTQNTLNTQNSDDGVADVAVVRTAAAAHDDDDDDDGDPLARSGDDDGGGGEGRGNDRGGEEGRGRPLPRTTTKAPRRSNTARTPTRGGSIATDVVDDGWG